MARRTMMSGDLENLLVSAPGLQATPGDYAKAAQEDNCLFKTSISSRKLTFACLKSLYDLDGAQEDFRMFKTLWTRPSATRGLLCLQYATERDAVLKRSVDYFLNIRPGGVLTTEDTYSWVEKTYPGRFSKVTATTIAKDLNSSWHQAGFFHGTRPRTRVQADVSLENIAFALYLAYRHDCRGLHLLDNEFTRLLEMPAATILAKLEIMAQCGLLVVRHLDDVLEIRFPQLPSAGVGK